MKLYILIIMSLCSLVSLCAQSVCIDPGHGGSDPGAVGQGLKEAAINLDVANRFYTLLANAGYAVYRTRSSDATVSLSSRTQYANSLGVARFISIHCNAFNGSANGTETYCYPGVGSVTLRLRDKTNPEVVAALGTYNRGCKTADFHVLRETNMPAILCELAFIDHAGDATKLGDAYYRQRAAEALKRGLVNAGREGEPEISADITEQEQIPSTTTSYYISPRFSNDGAQILVNKAGDSNTYAVPMAGGKVTKLTSEEAQILSARLDTQKIVLAENGQIYLVRDNEKEQLSQGEDVFFSPVLSPDKNWVLYQGLSTGMYLANVHNKEILSLGRGNNAVFTPNSQAIVFDVSNDNGQEITSSQIYFIDIANINVRHSVTSKPGLKAQRPNISPDGATLVFDSNGQIFVTTLPGQITYTEKHFSIQGKNFTTTIGIRPGGYIELEMVE